MSQEQKEVDSKILHDVCNNQLRAIGVMNGHLQKFPFASRPVQFPCSMWKNQQDEVMFSISFGKHWETIGGSAYGRFLFDFGPLSLPHHLPVNITDSDLGLKYSVLYSGPVFDSTRRELDVQFKAKQIGVIKNVHQVDTKSIDFEILVQDGRLLILIDQVFNPKEFCNMNETELCLALVFHRPTFHDYFARQLEQAQTPKCLPRVVIDLVSQYTCELPCPSVYGVTAFFRPTEKQMLADLKLNISQVMCTKNNSKPTLSQLEQTDYKEVVVDRLRGSFTYMIVPNTNCYYAICIPRRWLTVVKSINFISNYFQELCQVSSIWLLTRTDGQRSSTQSSTQNLSTQPSTQQNEDYVYLPFPPINNISFHINLIMNEDEGKGELLSEPPTLIMRYWPNLPILGLSTPWLKPILIPIHYQGSLHSTNNPYHLTLSKWLLCQWWIVICYRGQPLEKDWLVSYIREKDSKQNDSADKSNNKSDDKFDNKSDESETSTTSSQLPCLLSHIAIHLNDLVSSQGDQHFHQTIWPLLYHEQPSSKYMVYQAIFQNSPPVLPYLPSWTTDSCGVYVSGESSGYSCANMTRTDHPKLLIEVNVDLIAKYFEPNDLSLHMFAESINYISSLDNHNLNIRYFS